MSVGEALLLMSKEYSLMGNKPNTFSKNPKKTLDILSVVSILRTNVRKRVSNREVK